MRAIKLIILIVCMAMTTCGFTAKKQQHRKVKQTARHTVKRTGTRTHHASLRPAASISPSELKGFDRYPTDVKVLIKNALALSQQHLANKFGSDDPRDRAMESSGTNS
jgi:hypothetical protein